jgi:hypothetical protein
MNSALFVRESLQTIRHVIGGSPLMAVITSVLACTALVAQQNAALPSAALSGRTITLQPSGATMQIPDAVLLATRTRSGGRVARFTAHLSRPDLERHVKPVVADEWDGPYNGILNAVLPFEACAVHFGTEPFGPDGGSFFDLQARAYVVDGPAKPILDRIATEGLGHAKGKERFPDAAITTEAPAGVWNVTTLGFTMNRADYRASGRVDFYTREFGRQTVVLVFMHSPNARLPWAATIEEIVKSFAWPR